MKKMVFGAAALVLALAVTGGARAQRRGPAAAPPLQTTEWQGVSVYSDGQPLSEDDAMAVMATTDGSNFTLQLPDGTVMKGTYTLNKSTTPKQVDMITSNGAQLNGIYQVSRDGDTLKVCCAPAGQPRPTAFSSKPGSRNKLFVMKRVKNKNKNQGKPGRRNNRRNGK
jgi:uncharacterized protein (TIGR03067 family)